ncbi:cytidine deaminase [Flocculibacter collagenilyticus]|uniref:cytidine deaminase n=1 Tax=Flocculibacter collagenilyticus TaxID=2744479 RepID=UPI0018F6F5BB|nr:cytidine deaminase [Flocculibacter collagenilyticus]
MKNSTTQLLDAAQKIQQNAYAPYSKFKVGAAILANDNQVYTGCNIENASYPLGQCAEAGAIAAMIAAGTTHIDEVLVISPNDDICPPCGGCRQKLREFGDSNTIIHMATAKGEIQSINLAELLPLAFEKSNLLDE